MMTQDELLEVLDKRFSTDNKGDYFHVTTGLTVGVVTDTDDKMESGRIRVFVPAYGDDPSKYLQLPWAVYMSPFGGAVSSTDYERMGVTSEGAVAYGQWSVPEVGSSVVVACIDNDARRRIYLGSIPDHQKMHTLGGGRYVWGSDGSADGPFTSSGKPLEPLYSNSQKAFGGKKGSPEWQSREVENSHVAVHAAPNDAGKVQLDQSQEAIANAQKFPFNKEIMGGDGYDWNGYGSMPMKKSKVTSWTTPGLHSLVMDDRITSNRTKLRSTTGHTILLDDTNERIYVRTNTGNAWLELDSAGNIDVYAARRLSVNADMDVNINSKKTIRMHGDEGVFISAGNANTFPKMTAAPAVGQVRIQSQDDMHVVSGKAYRQLSVSDTIYEIGGNHCTTIGGTSKTQVQGEIDLISNTGDFNTTVGGTYNLIAYKNINEFSVLGSKYASKGNVEFYAYFGQVNIGAQTDITIKSVSGNINGQAVGGNSGGTGGINFKSPSSQMSLNQSGASISTNGSMSMQTGSGVSMQAASQSQQNQPIPEDQVPDTQCSLAAPVPVIGDGVDLAARVAYNAGFRGRSLVVAVAIAGAESKWNYNAIGDVGLQTSKWGPSCGFWQVRSLVTPGAYPLPDSLRVKDDLFNPTKNAEAAWAFSKQGNNFGAWTTYMNKAYLSYVTQAVDAINRMCNPVTPTPMALHNPLNAPVQGISAEDFTDIVAAASDLKPSVIVTATSLILQTLTDVYVNSSGMGESIAILAGIKAKSDETVAKCNVLASAINSCCNNAIPPMFPITDAGVSAPTTQIASTYFPYLNADSEQAFNLDNFDLNGRTIIP